jgi:uncharacterized membrane protein YgcG
MARTRRLLPLVLLFFAATALADELRWRSLDVKAKIDDDGTLHASERHIMIFDGEWNGGQRTIPLRVYPPPQRVTFDRVARVVSKKKTVDLTRVSDAPDRIDEYGVYNDGTTIRWRARLADDPPFRGKRLTYIIDYTLTNVLIRKGAPFRLDHDFVPADRPGPIEHFSLIVELPESLNQPPIKIARDDIPPGEGVLVRETYWLPKSASAPSALQPAAAAPPAAAPTVKEPSRTTTPITPFTARVIAFALLVLALLFVFRFFFGERAVGRLARVPQDQREWVDELLSKLDAEVVGVAWDGVVGQDEVAAILARMTAEGKIGSSVGQSDMTLKLQVPFATLGGYEADLVQALFLGKSETTTRAVRDHYAASGFDPARVVEHNVKSVLLALPQWEDRERSEWSVFWVLTALTCVLAIAGGGQSEVDAGIATMFGFLAIIASGLTVLFTIGAKRALTALWVRFFLGLLVPFCSVTFAAFGIVHGPKFPIHHLTAMMLASAALTVVVLAVERMKIGQTRQKVEFRKHLAVAREWLKREVSTTGTPIPDLWIPYLYALRLANQYSWHVQRVPPPPVYSPVRQYYDIVPPQSSSMQSAAYAMERETARMRDERRRMQRAREEMEREAKRASSFTSSWGSSSSRSSGSSSSSSSSSSSGRSSGTSGGGSAGGW